MNPVRHGPLGFILRSRDHAEKAVGRRNRRHGRGPAVSVRKGVGAAAEAVGAACLGGYTYRRVAAPVVRCGGLRWVA